MLISTCDIPAGQQVQILGLVRGNIVSSKHIGRDIMAGFKNIASSEIKSYTDMMSRPMCLDVTTLPRTRPSASTCLPGMTSHVVMSMVLPFSFVS